MEENLNEIPTTEISVKKHIMVYGKYDYILKNVQDLLDKANFASTGFTALPEASDYIRQHSVDAIFIGGGVDPQDRQTLREVAASINKELKIVEHYGGPATIIKEVTDALAK
jgi:hypothetical protein